MSSRCPVQAAHHAIGLQFAVDSRAAVGAAAGLAGGADLIEQHNPLISRRVTTLVRSLGSPLTPPPPT